jgi:transposase
MSKYEKEFKDEAVRLCNAKDANKATIARSLGVEYKTLCNWVYLSKSEIESAGKDELKRLKKENTRLKEENEILKKAATYFAKVAK